MTRLLEIAEIKRGAGSQYIFYVENGTRLIRINDFEVDSPVYVVPNPEVMRFTLNRGDILIAGTGATAGIVFKVPEKFVGLPHSYNAPRIRPNLNKVDSEFLVQFLKSDGIRKQQKSLFVGNAQPFLDIDAIGSFKIFLPPLPEQRRIAKILSTWDEAIEQQTKLIELKEKRKKALMQKLLSGEVRFPGFEGEWDEVKLADHYELNNQSLSEQTGKGKQFYYIDLSAVKEGRVEMPTNKISFEEAPSRARRVLKQNDVIIATVRPNLRGFAVADFSVKDIVCSTGFALVKTQDRLDAHYLYNVINSHDVTKQIENLVVGSNYPAINNADVENLMIPFPSEKLERDKMASLLYSCEQEINLLISERDALLTQKQGMMQQLLNGQLRVNA